MTSEVLEMHVEGGHVYPLYDQGRHGVVPPKAPNIMTISVLQILHPHHAIGRRHSRRLPPNAASVEEQGYEHCRCEPC